MAQNPQNTQNPIPTQQIPAQQVTAQQIVDQIQKLTQELQNHALIMTGQGGMINHLKEEIDGVEKKMLGFKFKAEKDQLEELYSRGESLKDILKAAVQFENKDWIVRISSLMATREKLNARYTKTFIKAYADWYQQEHPTEPYHNYLLDGDFNRLVAEDSPLFTFLKIYRIREEIAQNLHEKEKRRSEFFKLNRGKGFPKKGSYQKGKRKDTKGSNPKHF